MYKGQNKSPSQSLVKLDLAGMNISIRLGVFMIYNEGYSISLHEHFLEWFEWNLLCGNAGAASTVCSYSSQNATIINRYTVTNNYDH